MQNSPNQSISRGLRILRAVAASPEGMGVQEMADLLNVSRPTAHNLAISLLAEDFLVKLNKPVRYQIGPGPGRIAAGARGQRRLRLARELMLANAEKFPGSGWVYAEAGADEMRILLRLEAGQPEAVARVDREVSHPYDAATALIFHAFADETRTAALRRRFPFPEFGLSVWETREAFERALREIRKRGGVCKPWLSQRDVASVAAPVFDEHQRLAGAIGSFFPLEQFAPMAPEILKTAMASAKKLAAVG